MTFQKKKTPCGKMFGIMKTHFRMKNMFCTTARNWSSILTVDIKLKYNIYFDIYFLINLTTFIYILIYRLTSIIDQKFMCL